MIGLVAQKLGGKRHEHRATRAVVAAERRLGRVDDLSSLPFRLRPGAQRHRIHVRHEEEPIGTLERAPARQVDDEVARLGRQGNAGVGIVEADAARRNPGLLQGGHKLLADHRLLARHALDGKKAHQALGGSIRVDSKHGSVHSEPIKFRDRKGKAAVPTRCRPPPDVHASHEGNSPSQRVRRSTRVGAGVMQPRLWIAVDHADGAGLPGPVGPPLHVVADALELIG